MKKALLFLQKKKQKNSCLLGVVAPASPMPAISKPETSPRHCEPRSGAAIQKRAAKARTGRPTDPIASAASARELRLP
jgi:hypothetical protein